MNQHNPELDFYLSNDKYPPIKVEGTIGKRASGLGAIKSDLEFCTKSILTLIKYISERGQRSQAPNNESEIVEYSLWCGIALTYAKCFTQNEGRGTKLDFKDIFQGDDSMGIVHKHLMEERNNYFSHAGDTRKHQFQISIAFLIENSKVKPHISFDSARAFSMKTEKAELYAELISFTLQKVTAKLDVVIEKVTTHIKGWSASQYAHYINNNLPLVINK